MDCYIEGLPKLIALAHSLGLILFGLRFFLSDPQENYENEENGHRHDC